MLSGLSQAIQVQTQCSSLKYLTIPLGLRLSVLDQQISGGSSLGPSESSFSFVKDEPMIGLPKLVDSLIGSNNPLSRYELQLPPHASRPPCHRSRRETTQRLSCHPNLHFLGLRPNGICSFFEMISPRLRLLHSVVIGILIRP
jgi:hypothetical protein